MNSDTLSRIPWYNPNQQGKIFGIGLTKTGTMSLAKALSILGFSTMHYPWSTEDIEKHDATTDTPVACRFKELDMVYPNSKFILTTREFNDWITTTARKPPDPFKPNLWKLETRARMYGCLHFDKECWSKAYKKHYDEVIHYFENRPNDFLILPLESNNKWELLCQFLQLPVPSEPYPKINRSVNKHEKILL